MSTVHAATTDTPTTASSITTVAGTGTAAFGGDDGPATTARLNTPRGLAADRAGTLYLADTDNHRIRRITPNGTITTVAGTGAGGFGGDHGPATAARLNWPIAVAVDSTGALYIADYANHRVRKVAPDGTITTVAGTGTAGYGGDNGPATAAALKSPMGVALDSAGALYIADRDNHRVRKVTADGRITTVAGTGAAGFGGDDGPATAAALKSPTRVALDSAGTLYLADSGNHRLRKVTPDGTITTVAGTGTAGSSGDNGPAANATLNNPFGIAVDHDGTLYLADFDNHRVRRITPDGTITTVAGTGTAGSSGDNGPATAAQLKNPQDVALDSAGALYLAEAHNHRVRRVVTARVTGLPASGAVVSWTNVRSKLRMAVFRESTKDGAEVHQSLPAARDHQRWRLTLVGQDGGDALYTIQNARSGKVLEIDEARTADGAVVVQRAYAGAGARHQQWKLIPVDPGADAPRVFRIVNRNSGLSLRVETNAQGVVRQSGAAGDDEKRQWRMVPA
ncbi:RICIN domain-containing protein [Saccharothrix australiensis]|uniref:Sugar lactone lactonase YvrE n=1 Tax=Saccharothrix australiensis TaxID=2072 RepID=A0A495VZB7_9PSEU|nr:RICIN domain-containing protein [Saccharothrix australiensis]RKT54564.1 sugar lactone lactonase YvrE [Saccharothrix australiensis]